MIVGNGQIAKAFKKREGLSQVVIFASGVANSNCVDENEFEREKALLLKHLTALNGKKIVYFSSCALSAKDYSLTPYYSHKKNMESLIKAHTDDYYIFRVPQLFGEMKKHPTLVNYLYYAIKEGKEFTLYDGAYRYLIELSDLTSIVMAYIRLTPPAQTLDIANSYRYSVLDIVEDLESVLKRKGNYKVIKTNDLYTLDLSVLESFLCTTDLGISLGKDYLIKKLSV
ncbi:hypothetical protein [Pseudoalteromonas distincta]|uniref:hypothetical protein n=1 Tax=Pseudoalteromonas distincta TaxID=77608 RepID=UPI00243113DF|nr:hypothetical protein [Pseudoalteromonas distincta]